MDASSAAVELTISRRLRASLLAVAAVLAAAAGVVALTWPDGDDVAKSAGPGDRAPSDAPSTTGAGPPRTGTATATTTTRPGASPSSSTTTGPSTTPPSSAATQSDRPVRVQVPALGIDAPVILLGLDPDKRLEVPGNATDTGWWSGGSVPGTEGPAVIVGHVNYKGQAGVFQEIGQLEPGERVEVMLDDGTDAVFVVDRIEQHAKDAFPTDAVYGPTAGSELRLITCGGDFDRSSGHYEDNIVVFASAA